MERVGVGRRKERRVVGRRGDRKKRKEDEEWNGEVPGGRFYKRERKKGTKDERMKRKGWGGWRKGMKEEVAGGKLRIELHNWYTCIYAA